MAMVSRKSFHRQKDLRIVRWGLVSAAPELLFAGKDGGVVVVDMSLVWEGLPSPLALEEL